MNKIIPLLLSILTISLQADVKQSSYIDLGESNSLESMVDHIKCSYNYTVRFNPPLSKNVQNGYIVAKKLNQLGVIKFLHLKGDEHPYPKLNKISSIPVVTSKITRNLKEQISGYNIFMWDKAVLHLKGDEHLKYNKQILHKKQ